MTNLEIPFEKDRHGHYRFFEILPGALSWLLLFLPLILTFINVTLAVVAILCYLLIYFVRSLAYSVRGIAGYRAMKQQLKLDWNALNADLDAGKPVGSASTARPRWHHKNLRLLPIRDLQLRPGELTHAVIVATVNESREVLEPTIQAIAAADYDTQKIILVIAYEGRAGEEAEQRVQELIRVYGDRFGHAMAVKHPPNLPEEIIGKGGNITYAARELKKYLGAQGADMARVLVTTLDADNRRDKRYFAALSYLYCVVPKPLRASYQPLPMFTNNIWDAPTLMRVIATGNNLFLHRRFPASAHGSQLFLARPAHAIAHRHRLLEPPHHRRRRPPVLALLFPLRRRLPRLSAKYPDLPGCRAGRGLRAHAQSPVHPAAPLDLRRFRRGLHCRQGVLS